MLASTQCSGCGHFREEQVLSQLQELQVCSACGLTANESGNKMQEELVGLFGNFHVQGQDTRVQAPEPTAPTSTLGYSSSQHYYPPPAHLAQKNVDEVSAREMEMKQILLENGINASHLLTSQLRLFSEAEAEQRERLIELWRIAPPEQTRADGLGGWKDTTLEQEEELAKIRYARRGDENSGQYGIQVYDEVVDMDSGPGQTSQDQTVEPYMKSGYEILAERDYNQQNVPDSKDYRQSLDPAFTSKEWWKGFSTDQPLEYQYGMFEQMNSFRPAEADVAQEDEMML